MLSSPIFSAMALIILVFMCSSKRDNLFLSTCEAIINSLPYTVMFDIHLSYGLTTNPCDLRVFTYRSYHNITDYMQPYTYFNSLRYNTFTPFSNHIFSLCYGYTSHMMSMNSSSIFNTIIFLLAYQN